MDGHSSGEFVSIHGFLDLDCKTTYLSTFTPIMPTLLDRHPEWDAWLADSAKRLADRRQRGRIERVCHEFV